MIKLLIHWAVVATIFMGAASALPSVKVRSWSKAFLSALVFGIANVLLGWLLQFLFKVLLFLPAVLSFGLAYLFVPILVNMILLRIADAVMGESFEIGGWKNTFLIATALAVASAFFFH